MLLQTPDWEDWQLSQSWEPEPLILQIDVFDIELDMMLDQEFDGQEAHRG